MTRHNKKSKGGDDCYLLQVCSDKIAQPDEQGETTPDNGRKDPWWWLDVNPQDLNIPTNPKARPKPGMPAEPMIVPHYESSRFTTSDPYGAEISFIGTPELVAPPLQRVVSYGAKLPEGSVKLPGGKAVPTTYRVPTSGGGVVVPRSPPTYSRPQKVLAANKVAAKGNILLALVDLGTSILEAYNDGKLQTAADVANIIARYPDEVAQGLRFLGEETVDAIMRGDLAKLGNVVASVDPGLTTTRLSEEVFQATGLVPPPAPGMPLFNGGFSQGYQEGHTITGSVDAAADTADQLLGMPEGTTRGILDSVGSSKEEIVKTATRIGPWRWLE